MKASRAHVFWRWLQAKVGDPFSGRDDIFARICAVKGDKHSAAGATHYFKAVQIDGVIRNITDSNEKARVLQLLMEKYQPEGQFKPLTADDPMYAKPISKTGIFAVDPERVTARLKFGQNYPEPTRRDLIAKLTQLVAAQNVESVIVGMPRNMDGSEGPRCQSTRAFARNLEKLTDLPISFWDERLSTVAAERALLEADTSRKRRAEVIDHVAASYILQGALDRLSHLQASTS